jgi:hypothetical protein
VNMLQPNWRDYFNPAVARENLSTYVPRIDRVALPPARATAIMDIMDKFLTPTERARVGVAGYRGSTWGSRVRSLLPPLPTRRYVSAAARARDGVLRIGAQVRINVHIRAGRVLLRHFLWHRWPPPQLAAMVQQRWRRRYARANAIVPRYLGVTCSARQLLNVAGDGGIAELDEPLPAVRQRAASSVGFISANGDFRPDHRMLSWRLRRCRRRAVLSLQCPRASVPGLMTRGARVAVPTVRQRRLLLLLPARAAAARRQRVLRRRRTRAALAVSVAHLLPGIDSVEPSD